MELPKLPEPRKKAVYTNQGPIAFTTYDEDQLGELMRQAVLMERERCCGIIFGMCESDNVAQRTVDKIRLG